MSQGRNTVVLPLPPSGKGKAKMCTLSVLTRFGFEAPLLRSGVVAVDSAAAANTAVLFVHGAPSVIEQLVSKDTLPFDYRQVIKLDSSVCKTLQGCGLCILPIQSYYCRPLLLCCIQPEPPVDSLVYQHQACLLSLEPSHVLTAARLCLFQPSPVMCLHVQSRRACGLHVHVRSRAHVQPEKLE